MVTLTPDGKSLFEFYRPGAHQLVIAGDFNGWQPTFHMQRGNDGWWRAQVELAPGTYRFRYQADGEWFTDFAAFGVEPGPFGFNSVLRVEPATPRIAVTMAPKPAAVDTPVPVVSERPAAPRPAMPRPLPATAPIRFVADAEPGAEPKRRVRRRPALAG